MSTADVLFATSSYTIEQPSSVGIPGYLIVRPRQIVTALSELPLETLRLWGPLLAAATQAIQEAVKAERIYYLRFGEEVEAIHIHLFPRTAAMGALFSEAFPGRGLNGPLLFDWIRRPENVKRLPPAPTLEDAAALISASLRGANL